MDLLRSKQNAVALAEDTTDLLDHIAWTEGIKPRLEAMASQYSGVLVESALGAKVMMDGKPISTEQIAGRLYGIRFIGELFKEILRRGERAIVDLEAETMKVSHT